MNKQNSIAAGFRKFPIIWGAYALICGFLFWELYSSSVDYLLDNWNGGDYSYAWLIPFVVIYLVWEKRGPLSAEPVESTWWGIAPLVVGIAFFWLGELSGNYYTLHISAWLILVAILWLHLGLRKMKVLVFPVSLILTVFPLPSFLYGGISFELQLISSRIAAAMLQIVGIVAHREGNVIDIGVTQLQVVEACSGLRYVFPLLVLGLIVAYFFRASLWKRVFIVLSTIPLTIFWNSARIALTGVLWIKMGPTYAEGFAHDLSGFVIFLMSLVVLLAEMWALGKIALPPPKAAADPAGGPTAHLPRALTAIVLLGTTLFFFHGINFRQKIVTPEPLSKFPLNIAQWHGGREQMDPETIRFLNLSDYTLIDYRNTAGQNINFYVAYLGTQLKGKYMHSPTACLPGHGWVTREADRLQIPVKYGQDNLNVNRMLMEQAGGRELVYFWFLERGRNLTTDFRVKLYNFWDALTQHRTDGALVRVITPIARNESVDEAGSRLNEFLSKLVPILDPFIPGKELQRGQDRLSHVQTPASQ